MCPLEVVPMPALNACYRRQSKNHFHECSFSVRLFIFIMQGLVIYKILPLFPSVVEDSV